MLCPSESYLLQELHQILGWLCRRTASHHLSWLWRWITNWLSHCFNDLYNLIWCPNEEIKPISDVSYINYTTKLKMTFSISKYGSQARFIAWAEQIMAALVWARELKRRVSPHRWRALNRPRVWPVGQQWATPSPEKVRRQWSCCFVTNYSFVFLITVVIVVMRDQCKGFLLMLCISTGS